MSMRLLGIDYHQLLPTTPTRSPNMAICAAVTAPPSSTGLYFTAAAEMTPGSAGLLQVGQ